MKLQRGMSRLGVAVGGLFIILVAVHSWMKIAARSAHSGRALAAQGASIGHAPAKGAPLGSESDAPGTGEQEPEQATGQLIDEAINRLDGNRLLSRADAQAHLAAAAAKAEKVWSTLPAYAETEAFLKEKVRQEYGDITTAMVPELVARSSVLKEQFWDAGDFNSPASFQAIYEARAMLELCLKVAPNDEKALRELCDVIMSGWPAVHVDGASAEVERRSMEGRNTIYAPLKRLWEEHISKKEEVSFDDLLLAYDFVHWASLPAESLGPALSELRKQNPHIKQEEWMAAATDFLAKGQRRVAEWALDVCTRRGAEWSYYAEGFRRDLESLDKNGWFARTWPLALPQPYERDLAFRFSLGRGESFKGPASWRNTLVPVGELRREKGLE